MRSGYVNLKTDWGVKHLMGHEPQMRSFLNSLLSDEYVVIGDSLHDKEVADAIGARCVFYGGGSHDPSRLITLAPVARTLVEAVSLAIN